MEKVEGFKRLDRLTRNVERTRNPVADFDAATEWERQNSSTFGGRTVFDDSRKEEPSKKVSQGSLF